MFVATQLCQSNCTLIEYISTPNNWCTIETRPSDPFVLRGNSPSTIFTSEDRDHTGSRRIKPNSRTLLIGEQPNPSKVLRPEDRVSRHRGVKLAGQCAPSRAIKLFFL